MAIRTPSNSASGGRRAKIICTLGPSTDSDEIIQRLVKNGMDAARLNLSFGPISEHEERIRRFRRVIKSLKSRPVAIIADIPGRKIRIGHLEKQKIHLKTGQQITLVPDDGSRGNERLVPIAPSFFHKNMSSGDRILLSDGVVEILVADVKPSEVVAEVVYGGDVRERTAAHVPGAPLQPDFLTENDLKYLKMAVDNEVDYLALTYVADGADIVHVRERLQELGRDIPIIAKIERSEAFSRLDGILRRADAVMIRRGDLGADIEVTRIPLVQKKIIQLATSAGVPVIMATQMLGSMISSPRPTRAEASDVSNAIADGVDGVLLSAETAVGAFPVEAVTMMGRIIHETEQERVERHSYSSDPAEPAAFADTTAGIACRAGEKIQAKMVACFTESGRTAQLVAKYRPDTPILAFCSSERTRRILAINWGIRSDELDVAGNVDRMVEQVQTRLIDLGLVENGDRLVIVFGAPVGITGHTNSVRLHEVGVPARS